MVQQFDDDGYYLSNKELKEIKNNRQVLSILNIRMKYSYIYFDIAEPSFKEHLFETYNCLSKEGFSVPIDVLREYHTIVSDSCHLQAQQLRILQCF